MSKDWRKIYKTDIKMSVIPRSYHVGKAWFYQWRDRLNAKLKSLEEEKE